MRFLIFIVSVCLLTGCGRDLNKECATNYLPGKVVYLNNEKYIVNSRQFTTAERYNNWCCGYNLKFPSGAWFTFICESRIKLKASD